MGLFQMELLPGSPEALVLLVVNQGWVQARSCLIWWPETHSSIAFWGL